ncbi:hypothetical protein SDJN02_23148, partial [Cucurbita argyrosperma subsp. argyrosperma]
MKALARQPSPPVSVFGIPPAESNASDTNAHLAVVDSKGSIGWAMPDASTHSNPNL